MRRLVVCLIAALITTVVSSPAHAGSIAGAKPRELPDTTLPGAGAFMGPVRSVRVNGIDVGYRRFGTGPDLVMATGETATMSEWGTALPRLLAGHFRVTMFDYRGVGYASAGASQPLTMRLMAEDTAALIRALGIKKPTLLGWSMGGEIGLTMAVDHPKVLGALVTTGGDFGGRHTVPAPPNVQALFEDPDTNPVEFLPLLFPPSAAAAQAAYVADILAMPLEEISRETFVAQGEAYAEWLRDEHTYTGLPKVRIPVLVTNGAEDEAVPPENAQRIHDRLDRASRRKVILFRNASHGMLFQDAARFVDEIVDFVSSTPR